MARFLYSNPVAAARLPWTFGEDYEGITMTHVVTGRCHDCKYTDCVTVCPVECFYEAERMLFIHPEECIDCEACVPECPVDAIFHEDNLPLELAFYKQINAEMASVSPVITERLEPLEGPGCNPLLAFRQGAKTVRLLTEKTGDLIVEHNGQEVIWSDRAKKFLQDHQHIPGEMFGAAIETLVLGGTLEAAGISGLTKGGIEVIKTWFKLIITSRK